MSSSVYALEALIGLACILEFGVVLATILVWCYYFRLRKLLSTGLVANGIVTAYSDYRGGSGKYPFIYYDFHAQGELRHGKMGVTTPVYLRLKEEKIGMSVEVSYLEANPNINALKDYLPRRVKEIQHCSVLMVFAPFLVTAVLFFIGYAIMRDPASAMVIKNFFEYH